MFGEDLGVQVEDLRLAVGSVVVTVRSVVAGGVRVGLVHALHTKTAMRIWHEPFQFTQGSGRECCPRRKRSPLRRPLRGPAPLFGSVLSVAAVAVALVAAAGVAVEDAQDLARA
ncbi:hypothetical protein GCM10009727_68200 [Actinomadura napierensis]|uniref:Uncharacterized protein n=1 Tax=Actinomadura napierensis TaxID=267854 RepID=A0ABP5M4W9_9ACTN